MQSKKGADDDEEDEIKRVGQEKNDDDGIMGFDKEKSDSSSEADLKEDKIITMTINFDESGYTPDIISMINKMQSFNKYP